LTVIGLMTLMGDTVNSATVYINGTAIIIYTHQLPTG
jgi:hypothetical protein